MNISDVQTKGSYYFVFDEKGKKISQLLTSLGELRGIASDFFVVEKGSYYVTYDSDSKKIDQLLTRTEILEVQEVLHST